MAEARVDLDKIIFTQFEDTNFYHRDNGPNVMVDDGGNRLLVNTNWSFYGVYDPADPAMQTSRQAGLHDGISLGISDIVDTDLVSEGGDREFNGRGVLIAIEDTEVAQAQSWLDEGSGRGRTQAPVQPGEDHLAAPAVARG